MFPERFLSSEGGRSVIVLIGVGDLGARIGAHLADEGHRIIGVRRDAAKVPERFEARSADITDPASLKAAATGLDAEELAVVFTVTAGQRTEDAYQQTYVQGMRAVVEALKPQRLVAVSSTAVYGVRDGSWVDESTPAEPTVFSGQAMVDMEQVAAAAVPSASSVRLGGVYGPGRTRFVDQVRAGKAGYGPTPAYTNRIHVDDAARLVAALAVADVVPPVVLGVDDEPASRADVITWIAGRLGVAVPDMDPEFVPMTNKRCRNTLAHSVGFEPRYPTFRDGYEALVSLDS